jgi:hypothetical protein
MSLSVLPLDRLEAIARPVVQCACAARVRPPCYYGAVWYRNSKGMVLPYRPTDVVSRLILKVISLCDFLF